MYILYFYGSYHEYHHARWHSVRAGFDNWRPGEGVWLVPGTDPEDPEYCRFDDVVDDGENEGDQNDETLEYMCELLEAREIEADEFRRQLSSVGYHPDTIARAICEFSS